MHMYRELLGSSIIYLRKEPNLSQMYLKIINNMTKVELVPARQIIIFIEAKSDINPVTFL